MQNDGGMGGTHSLLHFSSRSLRKECRASSLYSDVSALFLENAGCGGDSSQIGKPETCDEATGGAASLPVINSQSGFDEALLDHLLVAKPQVGDVG